MARQWRRCGAPLVWEQGPGEGAVFDPASGETHFLNELPALLLTVVDADWRDFTALVLAVAGPVELDPGDADKILAALAHLESAELVESRDDPT